MPLSISIRTVRRIFLFLFLLLILTDVLFVWINIHAAQNRLHHQLEEEGNHLHLLFDTQLTSTAMRMQQTAAYIAMDRDVQRLLLQGTQSVATEGGGTGGAGAAQARLALLQYLQEAWKIIRKYGTQQLHFETGDAVSFLRMHAPERYGDLQAPTRFTIHDAIRQRMPTMGFETGQTYSGIYGAVPVFTPTPGNGKPVFAGVVEAATSFKVMLPQLENATGTHFAVLFSPESAASGDKGETANPGIDWRIESSSISEVQSLLAEPEVQWSLAHNKISIVNKGGHDYAIFSFPLRDFQGSQDSQHYAAGAALAWWKIDDDLALLYEVKAVNFAYAVGAFLLIGGLLYYGTRVITRHLNRVIERQTEELRNQAIHDQLTGLYNRYHLDDAFSRECARARRYLEPLSIAILDLDHFKRVNDIHGHLVGDHVLADFAHLIGQRLRAVDLVFRYGGEEFLVMLGNTPAQSAYEACEQIRTLLMGSSVGGLPVGHVTVSIGVTTMQVDEPCDLGGLLSRADDALYRAKEAGRNRVEVFS